MNRSGPNELTDAAPRSLRRPWIGYAVAIGGTGAMLAFRFLLDATFGERAPLMLFSVSTLVATWYGGYKPGLVALLLGFLAGAFFFMEPRGSVLFVGIPHHISAFSYVAATTPVIAAIEALHRTQRRLEREIEERKKTIDLMTHADQALAQAAEQQKKLAHQLFESQETERRRIARELHDQAGQSLSLVHLHLQALQMDAGPNGISQKLNECSRIVEQVIEQVQKLSLDLRPTMLDDLGLIPALRWYINQARAIGLNAIFMSQPKEMRLDPMLETTCYRIVQEALSNVIRHAKAKWVCVDLRQSRDDLQVTISDNGVGFDPAAVRQKGDANPCLGLLGMEERAGLVGGQITFQSIPEHGTEVHVRFPLQPKEMPSKG